MYFNKKVLLHTAVVLSINANLAQAGTCSQDVVKKASDAGFLEYVLLNCVGKSSTSTTTSILNAPILDSQTCVASFGKSLTATGACLNEFTTLVSNIQAKVPIYSPFDAAGASDGCKYDAVNGLTMSYVCWNRLEPSLLTFYKNAGYPIYIGACDPVTVRDLSMADIFDNTIKSTLTSKLVAGATPAVVAYAVSDYSVAGTITDGASHIVPGLWAKVSGNYKATGVSLKLGMCYGAYQTILDILQGDDRTSVVGLINGWGLQKIGAIGAGPNNGWKDLTTNTDLTSLMTACKSDPSASACANSPFISGVKSLFSSLSGYDIGFTGPMCDADAISKQIDSLGVQPTPYQFFVMCGLLPSQNTQACSAAATEQYVASLKSMVGTSCMACYDEMSTAIEAFVTNSTATGACNSFANITSDACVAALAPVATAFNECSGADLYTKLPTSPSDSNTTDNSTTDGTATNDNSVRVLNSGLIVAVAVLAYLM